MSDAPIILLITFALFIQIEASSFEDKMSEELGMCNENMAVVWADATKVNELNKKLKKVKR